MEDNISKKILLKYIKELKTQNELLKLILEFHKDFQITNTENHKLNIFYSTPDKF